ncbi:unnamed protein product [Eruca vesicaria subsp. sativa]|uniref:Secreted protein n=1 Tax=Eruca vesicaria subsp. sativa TaxID=29727 RepID=A0ABC8KSS8_ERUVS|nr:unnamed protein product [Eruca vesicaria subsp. sativa]
MDMLKKYLFGVLRLPLRGAMMMSCGGLSSGVMSCSLPTGHARSMQIFFLLLFDGNATEIRTCLKGDGRMFTSAGRFVFCIFACVLEVSLWLILDMRLS